MQEALSDEAKANLMALPPWYNTFVLQAKRVIPKRRQLSAALSKDGRWVDAAQMFQHSKNFLTQGWATPLLGTRPFEYCSSARHWGHPRMTLSTRAGLLTEHPAAGAAIAERLQKGVSVSVDDLAVFMAGVIVPFMFGFFGPVRPSAMISLQHPDYEVLRCRTSLHRYPLVCRLLHP